jgi:peptidylprolyl isomerase
MPISGDTVVVNYTGKTTDGTVFDTSEGRQPLSFTIGAGEVIPGFDEAVASMKRGEKRTVEIPCAKAYGVSSPYMVQPIKLGETINIMIPSGQVVPARITGVKDGKAIIDFNPPMAGQDLVFDLELVDVVSKEEIDEQKYQAGGTYGSAGIMGGLVS